MNPEIGIDPDQVRCKGVVGLAEPSNVLEGRHAHRDHVQPGPG